MDSKQNSSRLAESYSNGIKGFSLKKGKLKKWIYEHDYTQSYIALKLSLTAAEFKRKLRAKELFDREQIEALIKLMGANEAYRVIYFPSARERRKIYNRIFT